MQFQAAVRIQLVLCPDPGDANRYLLEHAGDAWRRIDVPESMCDPRRTKIVTPGCNPS